MSYGWEPLPLFDFLEGMRVAAGATTGRRFLDVGSGIGEKLALAALLGWEPEGIELSAPLAVSSRMYWPHPVAIVDAFDFAGYRVYDLVYCYRPLVREEDQAALNRWIVGHLRPGALFFCAGGPDPDGLTELGGQVWRA